LGAIIEELPCAYCGEKMSERMVDEDPMNMHQVVDGIYFSPETGRNYKVCEHCSKYNFVYETFDTKKVEDMDVLDITTVFDFTESDFTKEVKKVFGMHDVVWDEGFWAPIFLYKTREGSLKNVRIIGILDSEDEWRGYYMLSDVGDDYELMMLAMDVEDLIIDDWLDVKRRVENGIYDTRLTKDMLDVGQNQAVISHDFAEQRRSECRMF